MKVDYPKVIRRAVVVFNDSQWHWLSPLLKRGFGHCAVVVESNGFWVVVSPCPDNIRFTVLAKTDFDVAKYFRDAGFTVVEVVCHGNENKTPLSLSNCVGAVKAVLGIRKAFIITPYQLYKYILGNPEC